MAELATIARPYAEALFKATQAGDAQAVMLQIQSLADIATNAQLRQFAANPKVTVDQVVSLITSVLKTPLSSNVQNLLRTVLENGRLTALLAIASQFQALLNVRLGVCETVVYSAYPLDSTQLQAVHALLEKRFARKLTARVVVEPELIGGIRVVVGDEVLDTSVKARLEQMKAALTA
jgi:F-type H+-transporting ATPase subunit delta